MLDPQLSTGLPGLDRVLRGVLPGDNFVWQVESLADFMPFAKAFCEAALAEGKKLVYFRFADHEPLVPESLEADVHVLRGNEEFEPFVTEVHRVVQAAGAGTHFVFDCLSNLVDVWFSDRMLGNFFMLTCPAISECQSLAYFPLIRHRHSFHASGPITETTQILIDVFRHRGRFYIHPTKVEHRFSSTMNMLHRWDGDRFLPVMESSTTAEVLTSRPWAGLESVRLRPGEWTRTFFHAEEVSDKVRRGKLPAEAARQLLPELLRMVISRDQRVMPLGRTLFHAPRRGGNLETHDRLRADRRKVGRHVVGPGYPEKLRPTLERSARSPRFVLHRLERVLLVHGRKRLLVAAAEAARPRHVSRRHRGDPAARAGGPISPVSRRRVRRNARLFRAIADHRPFQQPAGRRLRQRLLRQVRERVLRQPGAALEAIAGIPLGRQDDLRQHDERKGPAIPRPARAVGSRRADVAAGAAGLRRLLRHPVLPANRRRRSLAQPLRLERVHRSRAPA